MDCSAVHRKMGTHITFVRSVDLDKWSHEQLMMMAMGGNDRAKAAFIAGGWHDMRGKADAKYASAAAAAYRTKLKAAARAGVAAGKSAWDLAGTVGALASAPSSSPLATDSGADDAPLGSSWVDMRSAEAAESADDARRRAEAEARRHIVMRPEPVAKGALSIAGLAARQAGFLRRRVRLRHRFTGRGAARGGPQGMRRARHEGAVRGGDGGGRAARDARELAARGGRGLCPTDAGLQPHGRVARAHSHQPCPAARPLAKPRR